MDRQIINALIDAMAEAVREKADTHDNLEDIAAEAAVSTGLRRAVWGTLSEWEKGKVIAAAVKRAQEQKA